MEISQLHILTDSQLAKMAQEGSETAEELLIEKYKNLVKSRSRQYFIVGADREDVVQEGMIGLFKAIRAYDPEQEASFREVRLIGLHPERWTLCRIWAPTS